MGKRKKLLIASENGDLEGVRRLLDAGANANAQHQGRTPLYWAAYQGHTELASLLLSRGADANMVDKNGRTPLYWAAYQGHTELYELLNKRTSKMGGSHQQKVRASEALLAIIFTIGMFAVIAAVILLIALLMNIVLGGPALEDIIENRESPATYILGFVGFIFIMCAFAWAVMIVWEKRVQRRERKHEELKQRKLR